MVPDVQFPYGRSVDHGNEVHCRNSGFAGTFHHVSYVNNVLAGSNPVEWWDFVARKLLALDANPPARMSRSTHGALFLGPLQGVQAQGRPMVLGITAGMNLLLQPK